MKDLKVKCEQTSGQVANDNKHVGLLDGKNGCFVQYPMLCCMVRREQLRDAPEYIQALEIADGLPDWLGTNFLTYKVQKLIGSFVAFPDPPKRTGKLSILNTAAEWRRLSVDGRLHMTASEYDTVHTATGSLFNQPVIAIPAEK